MKTLLIIFATFLFITNKSTNQELASYCGESCASIGVKSRMDNACGTSKDYTYEVTNTTASPLDIEMYVQKEDGWHDLGLKNNLSPNNKATFWSCRITGRYVFFYRTYGSRQRFPYQREISKLIE